MPGSYIKCLSQWFAFHENSETRFKTYRKTKRSDDREKKQETKGEKMSKSDPHTHIHMHTRTIRLPSSSPTRTQHIKLLYQKSHFSSGCASGGGGEGKSNTAKVKFIKRKQVINNSLNQNGNLSVKYFKWLSPNNFFKNVLCDHFHYFMPFYPFHSSCECWHVRNVIFFVFLFISFHVRSAEDRKNREKSKWERESGWWRENCLIFRHFFRFTKLTINGHAVPMTMMI